MFGGSYFGKSYYGGTYWGPNVVAVVVQGVVRTVITIVEHVKTFMEIKEP